MIIWKTYHKPTGREIFFSEVPFAGDIMKAFQDDEYIPDDYETYSFEVIML